VKNAKELSNVQQYGIHLMGILHVKEKRLGLMGKQSECAKYTTGK